MSCGTTPSIVRSLFVTAARPMKLPTSMCSGAIAHSPPLQLLDAVDPEDVRLDALDLGAERDEEAAEILHVRLAGGVADRRLAGREDGGHHRVLGRHHARLVEEDLGAAQAVRLHLVAALDLDARAEPLRARGCADRAGAARSRRRPAAARSPGRAARAAGRRAGTTPGSARRAPRRPRATRAPADRRAPRSGRSTPRSRPCRQTSSSIVSTSRMRGTFESVTGSSASRHAARIGRAPFLFPEARMRPLSGFPPSMTKACGAVVTDMPG